MAGGSKMEDTFMDEEEDCPELIPIKEQEMTDSARRDVQPNEAAKIPVTIITGYLGNVVIINGHSKHQSNPVPLLHAVLLCFV